MFERVTNYLENFEMFTKTDQSFDKQDISQAVASIFKQLVLVDGVIKQEEIACSIKHLLTHYGYLNSENNSLSITEQFNTAPNETIYSIAHILNKSLSNTQRKQLKKELLEVALSDDEYHPNERDLIELIDQLIKTR